MNYYYLNARNEQQLFIGDKADRNTVIENLINLRSALSGKEGIPEKKLSGNLILGTWNLREFGNTKYGGRMVESYYYIAEIISRFDLIAIQEVRDDLHAINSVLRILGNDWGIFISVVTQGASGNKERLAFIYDKRTVSFRNIAGQIIVPPVKGQGKPDQFARAPYLVRFQSGWLKFDICTVHIYYGKDAKNSPEYQRRVNEIGNIVSYCKKFYIDTNEANNAFILGDFNIEDKKSDTYKAATSSAFKIPDAILKSELEGTNVKRDKIYDQILYYNKYKDIVFKRAGIFDFYNFVFNELKGYKKRAERHLAETGTAKTLTAKTFADFRTYQMSDHLPLWVEMNTDHTDNYLRYLKGNEK